ncbi:DMT family transporter [Flexistipes sp.]|uniref:DMT family transporter n=1 Tax=Flexistipes sp. TaxID=3088135 RepID=UPI002E1AACD9|nr:DMT family transporter [Flexistipes sp.]
MPYLLAALSALLWSGNFVVGKGASLVIPPISLGYFRWLTACIILLPFSYRLFKGQGKIIQANKGYIVLIGLLGVAMFNTLIYTAVHYTSAINAILVNSFIPISILIVSFFMFGEKISLLKMLGILISFSGVIIVLTEGNPFLLFALSVNRGDILVLIAGFCWAFYSNLLKKYPKELNPVVFMQCIAVVGLIILTPFVLMENFVLDKQIQIGVLTIFSIAYTGVFASLAAFLSWNRAVREAGASKVAPFIHLMPVFGSILAVIFLGETFAAYHLAGIAAVFSGIFLATKY